jgi:tetratricopeptide (TPR) repeat protein
MTFNIPETMLVLKNKRYAVIIWCIVSCIYSLQASAQPHDDHSGEIMQIKGKWTKHANNIVNHDPQLYSSQYPALLKKTDTLASFIREIYPDPVGLEATYYSSIGMDPVGPGAPAAYASTSYYSSYYFNTNFNKVLKGGETETWINIYVNSPGSLLKADPIDWMIDGKLTKIYTTPEKAAPWKGFDVYEEKRWGADIRMPQVARKLIMITRAGRSPLVPLTQKQYLQALKYHLDQLKKDFSDNYTRADKEYQQSIDRIRNSTSLKEDAKEKIIADLQKQHERSLSERDDAIRKISADLDRQIKIINDYLSSHSEMELRQAAATTLLGSFDGHFGPDGKKKISYPVVIDPSYFDPKIPRYVPQLIVMEWTIGTDVPKTKFGEVFESGFPINKLVAMIDATRKDDNWSKDPVIKMPDLAIIRKRAEQYADKNKRPSHVIPAMPGTVRDSSFDYKIPSRNGAILGALPGKTLSPVELKTYLEAIDKKYTALLAAARIELPDVSTASGDAICGASILSLMQGMSDQAAWLAIKAIEKSPDDILTLTNGGAILNACGFNPVAIPVLETALQKSPDNSTVENNLGQSYLVLGDVPKATQYLQQAIRTSPYHPHANFALACINYAKGNKSSALSYCENSLRGSFTDGAWHLLYKLKPKAHLIDYFKKRYKQPDYFNEDKYHLPMQCEKTSDITSKKAEYRAYHEMVEKVKREFDAIKKEEYELGKQNLENQSKNQQSNLRYSPFTELGAAMMMDIALRFQDQGEELGKAQTIYKEEIRQLDSSYRAAYTKVESCPEKLALSNKYMEVMSLFTKEYQHKSLLIYKDHYEDVAYWSMIAAPDPHTRRAAFATTVSGYLGVLLQLAETHFLDLCQHEDEPKKTAEEYEIPKPPCPFEINLKFVIGSFKLDCEKVQYSFSGVLFPIVANGVHSFRDHHTTMAIGFGVDLKYDGEALKAGPIEGGFQATGKMQYFITFDGTHPSDQGFIWEGAVKYEQSIKTGNEDIKKITTTDVDISAKTVLSLHNGTITSSGSLYENLGKIMDVKQETQKNKNVKIYNH